MSQALSEPKAILAVAPHWVGDSLFFLPAVDAVQRRYPGAAMDLLAKPGIAALHEGTGRFQAVHRYEAAGRGGRFASQWGLRALAYDLALVFPDSFSAALGAWLSGARSRVGRRGQGRSLWLSPGYRLPARDRQRHVVDEYLDLARACGAEAGAGAVPTLSPSAAARSEAEAWFKAEDLGLDKVVGLCPSSAYGPSKEWPSRHWLALALALRSQGLEPVFFCAPDEAPRLRALAQAAQAPLATPGLSGLAGALAACKAVVANDSGPLHLAAAVGTPCVGLYGPVSTRWSGPRGAKARGLSRDLDCSPCYAKTCPLGHHDCLEKMEPAQVLRALQELGV